MGIEYYEGYNIMCDNPDCDMVSDFKGNEGGEPLEEQLYWEKKALEKEGWIFEKDKVFCSDNCREKYYREEGE